MTTKLLNREQYLDSVTQMTHFESLKFAKQSLDWWDSYYSWTQSPCLCLEDKGIDVCYLFYHVTKDKKYLTIHNIFTPFPSRFKGYGKELLSILFKKILLHSEIERVKMFCVSTSLKFYMSFGIDFWGVNSVGHYYTDFPMPKYDIKEIAQLMHNEHLTQLSKEELNTIYDKLKLNGSEFDEKETHTFQSSVKLLKEHYRFEELYDIIHI